MSGGWYGVTESESGGGFTNGAVRVAVQEQQVRLALLLPCGGSREKEQWEGRGRRWDGDAVVVPQRSSCRLPSYSPPPLSINTLKSSSSSFPLSLLWALPRGSCAAHAECCPVFPVIRLCCSSFRRRKATSLAGAFIVGVVKPGLWVRRRRCRFRMGREVSTRLSCVGLAR